MSSEYERMVDYYAQPAGMPGPDAGAIQWMEWYYAQPYTPMVEIRRMPHGLRQALPQENPAMLRPKKGPPPMLDPMLGPWLTPPDWI